MQILKWEYKISQVNKPDEIEMMLNRYGGEGWELVSVTADEDAELSSARRGQPAYTLWTMFYKRPKP